MSHFTVVASLLLLLSPLAAASQTDGPTPTASNGKPFPWSSMRLPDNMQPLHYDLLIHPNLTSLDFIGEVDIKIAVQKDSSTIILHSKDLQISNAALLKTDGSIDGPLQVLEYPAFQQIALLSDSVSFRANNIYTIHLKFAANLSESFHGFYKSSYRTSKGEVR